MRNKFEQRVFKDLTDLGVKFKYESEKIPYLLARHYIPDFIVTTNKGNKIYIECKGYLRPEDKSKLVAVKKLHPAMDLRILFQVENKRYIKWAVKNWFPYACGSIPEGWLNED